MKKHIKNLEKTNSKNTKLIRLNKYISNCGYCSRREADALINDLKVKVNNKVIKELGYKVEPNTDTIKIENKLLKNFNKDHIYLLLNKPTDCLCSKKDEKLNRKTVYDYLPNKYKKSLNYVGRLDYNSEGILLFTNNKPIINKLTHPSYGVKKLYLVRVRGQIPKDKLDYISKNGIKIDGFLINNINISNIRYTNNSTWFEIQISEGRNREIRKIVSSLGYEVSRLKRIAFGKICSQVPPKGKFRLLSKKEIEYLNSIK